MEFEGGLKIKGVATITLRDSETGEEEVSVHPNMVVNTGLNHLLERWIGTSGVNPVAYLATGTGSGTVDASDTAMWNELTRKAVTAASVSGNVLTYRVYFTTAESIGSISELGLFDAPSGGTMIAHIAVSPAKDKTSAKEMLIDITHVVSRA